MEKLLRPADYAKMVGISRQAVYMKIKKGLIPSKTVDGKIFVILNIDDEIMEESNPKSNTKIVEDTDNNNPYRKLIDAKDETISILKETIKDLKETNRLIATTLKSEVELLKEAFSEMKTLYTAKIAVIEENCQREKGSSSDEIIDIEEDKWISVDEILYEIGVSSKSSKKIIKRLKKLRKSGDERVKKENGKFYILDLEVIREYIDINQ